MRISNAVIAAVVSVALPISGAAQSASPEALHPGMEVAARFAPVLWFADDERLLPVIPHAMAFDGEDNNGNGAIDLDDPEEVGFGMRPMWTVDSVLNSVSPMWQVDQGGSSTKRPIWKAPRPRLIVSGPAERTGPDLGCSDRAGQPLRLLQYWHYYFLDQGVGPHLHDREHVFVYLDERTGSEWRVRGVVAASHESSTVNNILVTERCPNFRNILPAGLPDHTVVLVELGKHASAPDLDANGRFDQGVDANIFRNGVWGSRDTAGSNFGIADVSTFRAWQSFPRTKNKTLCPAKALSACAKVAEPQKRLNTYDLFWLEDLKKLYRLLAAGDKREVEDFLTTHRLCFWSKSSGPQNISAADGDRVVINEVIFDLMRMWPSEMESNSIWQHSDYQDPDKIFKLYQFPRLAAVGGYVREQEQDNWVRIGLQLAEFRLPDWRWIPFRGSRLLNSSTLEASVMISDSTRGWSSPAVRGAQVVVKGWRGTGVGGIVGLNARRVNLVEARNLSDGQLQTMSNETGRDVEFLRTWSGKDGIRLGAFAGFGFSRAFSTLSLEGRGGLVIEPRNAAVEDVALAFGDRSPIRAQLSIVLSKPIVRPRHPLSY